MKIEEFKRLIYQFFRVTLQIEEISTNEMPKCTLYLSKEHTNTIKSNLHFYTINDLAIIASQAAKFADKIPPFVVEAVVYEISDSPYTNQMQSLLPVV